MARRKRNAHRSVYRSYMFVDKDPIIDFARTKIADAALSYQEIAERDGPSAQTLYGWFNGKTRRPQFCTIAAALSVIGVKEIPLEAIRRGRFAAKAAPKAVKKPAKPNAYDENILQALR